MLQNNRPVSLWEILKEHTCVIPIIQRDYAQGRQGKEQLRTRFFGQLTETVVSNRSLTLDFVYGTPAAHNDNVIYPLDGQQRLTSLWLLYWYVAFRAEKLNDTDVCHSLKRFTYQTRTSSRDFCNRVCQELIGKNNSAAKLITEQPWFSRRFKTDPTIQAMLRSLSDEEHGSGLEQIFGYRTDFAELWERLISPDCPVKFYFRSTKEEHIANPDDLYIKMNARGKKLTDFENFKSELFSFKGNDGKEVFRDDESNFIKSFENEWTNLFWTLRHEKTNLVDHIQFEFFNRMVLAHILVSGNIKSEDKELYEHISKHKRFSSIEVYRNALTPEFRDFFASVMNGIGKLKKSGKEINSLFDDPYSFNYLPIYESAENKSKAFQAGNTNEPFWVSGVTLADIVRFYAASQFFLQMDKTQSAFDQSAFEDWMTFSRNLFENSGITRFAEVPRILELFLSIGCNCLGIIAYLCAVKEDKVAVSGDLLKRQFQEEQAKAQKIQECRTENPESEYKRLIRDAEKKYPFGGAIRFLFTNENGETDWSDFKTKKANFDKIINLKLDSYNTHLSPLALRTLLSYVESWDVLSNIWDIDSSHDSWKRILINKPHYIRPVHFMLLNGIDEEALEKFESPIIDPIQKGTHEELVKSKFLHQTTWASFTFRADHTAMVWNSRTQWKRYLLGTPRNRLIAEGMNKGDISIDPNRMLGDREHLWGEDLFFELKKEPSDRFWFWWNGTELRRTKDGGKKDVYIRTKDNKRYFPRNEQHEEFAIKVAYDCSYEDFINNLHELLEKADKHLSSGSV